MVFEPHAYQRYSIDFIINNPYCGLFLDMGLGKTAATLTAIDKLKYNYFDIEKVLVIAPLRVAAGTWSTEVNKWEHLKHLTISKVLGSEKERKKALREDADIYIINRENVPWLIGHLGGYFPFDMLVIDELSSFKSPKAERFKSLRTVRPSISRVVGLTGTPSPNSLMDLWSQMFLLDRGERLGKTITGYREQYFTPDKRNGSVVFNYKLKDGKNGQKLIYERIKDICVSMRKEDYLKLPKRLDNFIPVKFDKELQKRYDSFEKEAVLQFMDSEEISAVNAAALTNKLLQFSNGCIYDSDKNIKEIHTLKIKALEEVLDTAQGKSVLVFYSYKHDLQAISKHLKKYNPRKLNNEKDIEQWNNGEINLLMAHPASAGHGLNLQDGGSIIVWYGLTWSLEQYQQANARLHRQGQTKTVVIHHIIAQNTMDDDVMQALQNKADGQNTLLDAVKARVSKWRDSV